MSMKLIGADYLLLLLYLNDKEPIKGAVRLTKMMFLFGQQIVPTLKEKGLESDKLPEFFSYNYGPFSKDLYQQVDLFKNIGFIDVEDVHSDDDLLIVDNMIENEFVDECYEGDVEFKIENDYRMYMIADKGCGFVETELLPNIREEHRILLERFKRKITDMPINKLLYYVYTKYPEFTDKSLIKKEVLKNGN